MYSVPGNCHNCHDSSKPDPIKFSIVTLNKELPLLLAKADDTFIKCMYVCMVKNIPFNLSGNLFQPENLHFKTALAQRNDGINKRLKSHDTFTYTHALCFIYNYLIDNQYQLNKFDNPSSRDETLR